MKLKNKSVFSSRSSGVSSQVMKCIFTAPDSTQLSSYPWTGGGEIRPGTNQWVDVIGGDYVAQHVIQSNTCVGNGTLCTNGNCQPSPAARSSIDLGSPLRKLTATVRQSRADGKQDIQFGIRVKDTLDSYHPATGSLQTEKEGVWVQLLRWWDLIDPSNKATVYLLNIWGCEYQGHLLAQKRLRSDITWTANTDMVKVVPRYDSDGTIEGSTVIPTTPNGFKYDCIIAGKSHAVTEPTWPTTSGDTVTDGTVTWQCSKNIDYQTSAVPIEIIDTGSVISVTVDNDVIASACNLTNTDYTCLSLFAYHNSSESIYDTLEVWV